MEEIRKKKKMKPQTEMTHICENIEPHAVY